MKMILQCSECGRDISYDRRIFISEEKIILCIPCNVIRLAASPTEAKEWKG